MPRQPHHALSRRSVVAGGLGSGLLLMRPSLLLAAATGAIEPQPYFAGVKRALAALTRLGAPPAAGDAQQIAALARRGDAASVAAADAILARYTLLDVTIPADGMPQLAAGGARPELVEQGWRMFLVRIANPAARDDNIFLYPSAPMARWRAGSVPASNVAQRAFLMDTINKGPLIDKIWLATAFDSDATRSFFGREVPVVMLGIRVNIMSSSCSAATAASTARR